MNHEDLGRFACSEEFGELCAVSTTGALTADEQLRLACHLSGCSACQALLRDYRGLALEGAARMASASDVDWEDVNHPWDEARAKYQLLGKLGAMAAEKRATGDAPAERARPEVRAAVLSRVLDLPLVPVAAVILLSVLVGYYFGVKKAPAGSGPQHAIVGTDAPIRQQLAQLQSQRESMNAQLAEDAKTIDNLRVRSLRQERELAQIKQAKDSLEGQVDHLSGQTRREADALDSLSAQRDALQRRLGETQRSLENAREDFNRRQDDHQKALLRAASLEVRIEELSSQLRENSKTIQQQKDFFASDRDIRELMGARQLYIADVFDVDHNGKQRAPFGRVFYTKGKSLVFYAFDLDQPPGYRNAKAFQVWGSQSEDQSKPVSLGLFYMDSEANRRWVFKTNDPDTLAQINAVFVTVEPKGVATTPTSKPILYAYLRTAPTNHP